MAQKFFVRNLENFQGLDTSRSALSRDSDFAINAESIELSQQRDLQFIQYYEPMAAGFGGTTDGGVVSSFPQIGPRFGMDTYSYQDYESGSNMAELVGIGNGLWKLQQGTFVVDGPANSYVEVVYNGGYDSWTFKFNLYETISGTVTLIYAFSTSSLATSDSGVKNLYGLMNAVNANAGWTATLTPHAVVNGNQTALQGGSSITVDAGHTVSTTNYTKSLRLAAIAYKAGGAFTDHKAVWFDVLSTTATTMRIQHPRTTSYMTSAETEVFDVKDNDLIGIGMLPATCLPEVGRVQSNNSYTFYPMYWEYILSDGGYGTNNWKRFLNKEIDFEDWNKAYESDSSNFVARNISNCLYIGSQVSLGNDTNNNDLETGLVKYDGIETYAAGLPTAGLVIGAVSAAAGLDDGVYKYLLQYKRIDAQGNTTYGNSTLINGELTATGTNGAANNRVALTVSYIPRTDPFPVYLPYSSVVSGNQTLATGTADRAITLSATNDALRLGEWAVYYDRTSGEIRRRRISARTYTTISLRFQASDATETVTNNDIISNGITAELYRTKANGQTYYKVTEIVNDGFNATVAYTDSTNDTALGIEWDGPHIGRERRDVPPPMPIIETHQGLIVGGGYSKEPNFIYWATEFSNEYFPRSTNSLEIVSAKSGAVKALASAGGDTLLAFKREAYYGLQGDLYSNIIIPAIISEGDIGCNSPTGWCRVREAIIFMSEKGPRIFSGGNIETLDNRMQGKLENVTQEFSSSDGFNYTRITAFNHIKKQRVLFSIPWESSAATCSLSRPVKGSRWFVWDYDKDFWSTWIAQAEIDVDSVINASGGMSVYQDDFYFNHWGLASTTQLGSELFRQEGQGLSYFEPSFIPQWEFLSEPSFLKDFLELKVWNVTGNNSAIAVDVYRDFNITTAESGSTTYSTTSTALSATYKLTKANRSSITFDFNSTNNKTNGVQDAPFYLTGWELVINVPYNKERIDQSNE